MAMSTLFYFMGASVLLILAPGPDIVFIITQGIGRGRKAALLTVLGIASGILVHTMAAALGISAIFHSSALAFQAVKYAGAAYLLYLAYKTIRERGELFQLGGDTGPEGFALFRRGMLMNVLNPKVSLFFLAFLPQFVDASLGPVSLQMGLLGILFMILAFLIFSLIGLFAGQVGHHLLQRPRLSQGLGYGSALVFASLGLRLACSDH